MSIAADWQGGQAGKRQADQLGSFQGQGCLSLPRMPSSITCAKTGRLSHKARSSWRATSSTQPRYVHTCGPAIAIVPLFGGPTPIPQDPCRCITQEGAGS